MACRIDLIVIGGSAGALDVLLTALPALPAGFPLPIAIVLHLAPSHPSLVAQLLGERCRVPVREAEDKEPIEDGVVYLAPPNYHLLIERHRTFALSIDPPVRFSRPAIDVLFESVADAYRGAAAGVVLSGASADGADGLARIHAAGGLAFVQAPATAAAAAMPEAARIRLGAAARAVSPADLSSLLVELAGARVQRRDAS